MGMTLLEKAVGEFWKISCKGSLGIAKAWTRARVLIFASLLVVLGAIAYLTTANSAFAQTTAAAAEAFPSEKVQELLKLLDDAEVRSWIAALSADATETSSEPQVARWEGIIRSHLRGLTAALQRFPTEAANALQTVQAEINRHGFATIVAALIGTLGLGYAAEWLVKRAVQRSRIKAVDGETIVANKPNATGRLMEATSLFAFAVASMGAFVIFDWPRLLRTVTLAYLVAFIIFRLVSAVTKALLAPERPTEFGGTTRLVPITDAAAVFWTRRILLFTGYLLVGWATFSVMTQLGFSRQVKQLIVYLLGTGLLFVATEATWRRPQLKARLPSIVWNWLVSIYLVVLWGVWIAGFNGILWVGIYALILPTVLPLAGKAANTLAQELGETEPSSTVRTILIVRGARAAVVLMAVIWLGIILQVNPSELAQRSTLAVQIMRGALQGVVTLLVADLIWQLAKAYIDRQIQLASSDEPASSDEAARRARLRTLLPTFRSVLAVLIGSIAVLMVLAELGVQIAPLIAGAGIFGVAIGFGSQTLVKDVISGVFYMLDDAFRVGEYIQSGSYKGTVESFSLRSVKLRHHRGPVFTVPFGQLGAVQNMSRDWAIDKFTIVVPFNTDVKKVKKLLKGVGALLLEDPQFAPVIIETVKMKGVERFGDFGIELSFSMKTKPGHQAAIRRRTYNMIRDTFMENGIEFAQPTVQVGSDDKQGGDAAAAALTAHARRQIAQPVEG
jgi:small-conductance mechanosensitive channel